MKRNNKWSGKRRKFVYLIQAANGLTKIGVTADIEQRLRTLDSESPVDLKLLGCIESDDVRKLEKELHIYFNDKNVRYEWFRLSPGDINYIEKSYDFAKAEVTYEIRLNRHHHKIIFDF